MRGKQETVAYVAGMARVFGMKGDNERQEACERTIEIVRKATDKQSLLYTLRMAVSYQDNYGSAFASHAYDEAIQAVLEYIR